MRLFANTHTKADRLKAATRSELATSKLRTALRDYQIVRPTPSNSWLVVDVARDTIVARFDDVADATNYVATA